MRSATALRACIRQMQPRAAAVRQITSRRLAATAASAPRDKGKEPANARDHSSFAATAEGQREHEHEEDTSRFPPAQHSYFNFRLSKSLAASLALILGGTAVGIWFPPDLQVAYHPPAVTHALSAPVRRESGDQSAARLEKALATLPSVLALRQEAFELGEGDLWREMRHNPIHGPSGTIGNTNMLASALFGPEKIAIPPFLRERRDGRESVLIVHVGNNLCGHDGIVHGGLVATLFDQYLYRHGVQNLDAGIAATAHLSINYRAPVRANQFLVMKSTREEDSRKPHKVIIQGRLEDVNGKLLAEAKGVFVTPKDAKNFFKPTAGSAAPPPA